MKRIHIITIAAVVVVLLSALNYGTSNTLAQVQSGDLKLSCLMQDGSKDIDPAMVVDYHPDFGWEFTNGSAKNCSVN